MEELKDSPPCSVIESSSINTGESLNSTKVSDSVTTTDDAIADNITSLSKDSSTEKDKNQSSQTEFASPAPIPMKFQKPSKVKPKSEESLPKGDTCKQTKDKALKPNTSNDSQKTKEKSENMSKKGSAPKINPKLDTKPKPASIELPYREPSWGGKPDFPYSLEVIKDGILRDTFPIDSKSFYTFGRLEECDMTIDHPSSSRYHAVLQFCAADTDKKKKGFYLYDVGSTHGTKLNKDKIQSRVFCRVRVGHVIKFGGSSRLWILQGPEEDQEEELDIAEVRKKQKEHRESLKLSSSGAASNDTKKEDGEGISWGFGEDAVEEHLNLQDLLDKKRNIEVKDPKKYLRNFFESEGLEFEYEMEEKSTGRGVTHVAKVSLPIETSTSDEVIAEGSGPSKKEAVLACATDACRLLEAYDAINKISREDHHKKRQRELEANDYYDSDDDSFLDRTGAVEKKRLKRMKYAGKRDETKSDVETHESLQKKMIDIEREMSQLNKKLGLAQKAEDTQNDDADSLDAYMSSMTHSLDGSKKKQFKARLAELKKEAERTSKLIKLTKPTALPSVPKPSKTTEQDQAKLKKENVNDHVKTTSIDSTKKPDNPRINPKSMPKETNKTTAPMKIDSVDNTAAESLSQEDSVPKAKKKKVYGPSKPPSSKEDDADYASWLPPEGQTGDGKTHLNEKFGY